MHIRDYLAALEFANAQRRAQGLPPIDRLPSGRPGDSVRCAIARAVPGAVVGSTHVGIDNGPRAPLPREVAAFVRAFDRESVAPESDPGTLVDGGIEDDKGCLVPA
ncbi:MAG TPA: hypothetical protein VK081_00265 [Planctomycetota bacterium]|nr:hypothetical protein [Planctomycetota bacterium]